MQDEIEESLLEQAKKKYPVGTQFKTIYGVEKICTVTYDNHILHDNNTRIIVSTDNGTGTVLPNSAAVYGDNKWAEIIKPEIDSWCVKVNNDNVKIVKKYFTDYPNNAFQNGSVYGIDKTKIQNFLQKSESGKYISLFDRLITTEEFYEKIGHRVEKKYEVVHCTTQEELDFACKILKSHGTRIAPYCVHLDGDFDSVDHCKKDSNYKIYSFQEWCEKFGHKPDFNKSIEKWSVGSYVVFVVDYGGHPKGSFSKITRNEDNCVVVELVFEDKKQGCRLYKDLECKWFPTLKEAEEFAKSLVKPTEQFTKPLTPEECYPNVNVGDVVSWDCSAGEYEVWKVKDGRFWIIYKGEKHGYQNYSLDVKGLKVVKKSNECYDGNKVNTYFRDECFNLVADDWKKAWSDNFIVKIDPYRLLKVGTHQLSNKKGKKFSPIKAELINVKKLKIMT